MIRFNCDYQEGAHERILNKLMETNLVQSPGYGEDDFCEEAKGIIRDLCQAPNADVHFLVGGTQANFTFLSAALRCYQGVVSAESGHIAVHETGAVEATGHKILPVPSSDGKLTAQQILDLCHAHYTDPAVEHKIQPGMVYISHPTEMGTVYTLEELEAIRKACNQYDLKLFVDGARLVYGLAASDITLPDLARLCDAFYLGGTKAGLLFGEAVVITNDELKRDFRYYIKQRGGMLAKGRLLGVQFEALLENGLYKEIGQRAVAQAQRLQKAFLDKGWELMIQSPTNQQFPIVPNELLAELDKKYSNCFWNPVGDTHTAVRYCTAWSSRDEDIDALIADIKAL